MSRGQVERMGDTRGRKVMEVSETSAFVLSFAQNRFLTVTRARASARVLRVMRPWNEPKIRTKIGGMGSRGVCRG